MISAKIHRSIYMSILMGLLLAGTVFFACTDRVYAESVDYMDENGWMHTEENCIPFSDVQNYTIGDSDGKPRWYVVDKNIDYNYRLNVLGDARIILKDGCKLNAKYGIHIAFKTMSSSKLTIYAQSTGREKGELIADAREEKKCAGIGGNEEETGGNVEINGGKITVFGGYYAAAIGGGINKPGGNVTINGGDVTAYNGKDGAGIGGGEKGDGGSFVINGGTVTAFGGNDFDYGAAIGGGMKGNGGSVIVNGGKVVAYGGNNYGAALGGGDEGKGGYVKISGGTVEAYGGREAAAIGGGQGADGGECEISGGTVKANGGNGNGLNGGGAGIGGGENGDGGKITITGGNTTANGGRGVATGGAAAGIGGGESGSGGKITITGGHITANGGGNRFYSDGGAGIGGGADGGDGGTIYINGGHIFAKGGETDGALDFVSGGSGGAGIGGGEGGSGGTIIIESGIVSAWGGEGPATGGGAGIGGGDGAGSGQTIKITGGNITAHGGGNNMVGFSAAAGIGGGDGSEGGSITIDLAHKDNSIQASTADVGSAIGSGKGGGSTTVNLADNMRVSKYIGGRQAYTPVPYNERLRTTRTHNVRIVLCQHEYIDEYLNFHQKGHKQICKYCYWESMDPESGFMPHEIDSETLKCTCGYSGVRLSFERGSHGQGSMDPEILMGNTKFPMPEPTFEKPDHYEFAGWMIDGSLYKAGEDYTTPPADEKPATVTAVAQWTMKDHDWGEWETTIEATEEEEGVEIRVCKMDPTHVDTRSIPVKEHVHDDPLTKVDGKPATCTESGQKDYYKCNKCSAIYEDENAVTQTSDQGIKIAATGHKAGDPVADEEHGTKATCSSVGGYNVYTRCTNPGCTAVLKVERVVIPFDTDVHDWDEWVVSQKPTAETEGIRVRSCKSDSSHTEEEKIPKDDSIVVEYSHISEGEKIWTKGSKDALSFTFKCSVNDEKTFDNFRGIQIDGDAVDIDNYTADSGSVIIKLKPEYLEKLAVGTHSMTAYFRNGNKSATADFTIKTADKPADDSQTTPSDDQGSDNTTPTANNKDKTDDDKSSTSTNSGAKTGDENRLLVPIALLAASACAIATLLLKRKR